MKLRTLLFFLFSLLTVVLFSDPLIKVMGMSLESELYSHIILIPFVSGYFFYSKRKILFSNANYSFMPGTGIILIGIILYFVGIDRGGNLSSNDHLALLIFSAVTCWIGGFVLFNGGGALRDGAFPLLFLFFLTPIPSLVTERAIVVLQIASTEVAYRLFKMIGVPILREGFVFHLPGTSIQVGEQCSGIRSSIGILIVTITVGQIFLRSGWKKSVFAAYTFPVTVFKNAVRIVVLSLLGIYWDPQILSSQLHRRGGIPFFAVALILLSPVLWALRKSEKQRTED